MLSSKYITNLREHKFHKLIIGASLKDYQTIEEFAYLFTHASADAIDISAFPHSVISAKRGIAKALAENPSLTEPLIMVSVNIGEDPHFRRVQLDMESCTECLLCVPTCPSLAFTIDAFEYNSDLCFGCSACIPACPSDALTMVPWDSFETQSLTELVSLGASAIEIHLNNDLESFSRFYRSIDCEFELESFCVGSGQMNNQQILEASSRIIEEHTNKHGKHKPCIIQCDGSPMSGALNSSPDKDLATIQSAQIILKFLESRYPDSSNVFVQLAGGITEQSLAKALSRNIWVAGVAIGSYARAQISMIQDCEDKKVWAFRMLQQSRSKS